MGTRVVACALLVGLAAPAPAAASLAKKCRKACVEAITTCVRGGAHRQACRKRLLAECKHEGMSVCLPTTTTTTTADPITSTTTTTTPGSTCPTPSFDARGTWTFSGTLQYDPCGLIEDTVPYDIDIVTQCGDDVTGSIEIGNASVTGHLTGSTGFVVTGQVPCNTATGCCTKIDFEAHGIAGNQASTATLNVTEDCGTMVCPDTWSGPAVRASQ
jgi:hypothetical protein